MEDIETHILRRYQIQKKLGKGMYAIVWQAIVKRINVKVAIKKIFDAFINPTDAQRTFREVIYLLQLEHNNIIKLLNVHKSKNNVDIYLIFEHMETDLHTVIRGNVL